MIIILKPTTMSSYRTYNMSLIYKEKIINIETIDFPLSKK